MVEQVITTITSKYSQNSKIFPEHPEYGRTVKYLQNR